jgi:hypothetical protein
VALTRTPRRCQGIKPRLPMVAAWDDHDFGLNDGGASWQFAAEAKVRKTPSCI